MKLINCNTQEVVLYQAKNSDTISSICAQFNVNENNVIRNNALEDLYEGEVVKIVRKNNVTHIVKPMETLSIIAQKYNVNADQLIKVNNLSTRRLFVGQILIIEDKQI